MTTGPSRASASRRAALRAPVRRRLPLASRYHWSVKSARTPQTIHALREILLENRGVAPSAAEGFLAPSYEQGLSDPLLLPQSGAAVARIQRALRAREPIAVFGDYDVDGITGAALLAETLERLGGQVVVDLPHRDEGYGLSPEAVQRLVPPARLLITVDNGTSATAAVADAIGRGAGVIVIDHHLANGALPAGALLVNPTLPSSRSPRPHLAAAGVAWKIAAMLLAEEGRAGEERFLLDLVCLGLLADSVDLRGENRTLVRWGIEVLRHTRRLGLTTLAAQARLSLSELSTEAVTFRLIPRLNAAGRLRHASLALDLLRATDAGTARRLAVELDAVNTERRALTEELLAEATRALGKQLPPILFVAGPWPVGLLGILAARLAEEHQRPAVAVAVREGGCVASIRGDGVNVLGLVRETETLLTKFGGHAGAAGFSFPRAALDDVAAFFLSHAPLSPTAAPPGLSLDCPLSPALVTLELPKLLEQLEPFGNGNQRPVFLLQGLSVVESRPVGTTGEHLRFVLRHPAHPNGYTAVAFRWGDRPRPSVGDAVDLAVEVRADRFRGTLRVDLHVRDLREAAPT